jgi:hypothetical protein
MVRPIAVCIFVNIKKHILAPEGFDHVRNETFYRSLRVKLNSSNMVQAQCIAKWSIADFMIQ